MTDADPTAPAPPRVSRARAALTIVAVLTAAGALTGLVWSVLAPPARGVIALNRSGERVHAYLGAEADHLFVSAFLLVGMLSVVGVVAAVAVWQWRPHRGPLAAAALAVGTAAGSAAAAGIGAALVRLRYGVLDLDAAPVSEEHRVHHVAEAPPVFFGHTPAQIALTVLFPVAAAALVYALAAVAAVRDDLGGWPPQESAIAPVPTTGGALPADPAPPSR